jgi:hypothetical protein
VDGSLDFQIALLVAELIEQPIASGCSTVRFGPAMKPSRDIEMSRVSLAMIRLPPGDV